MLTDLANNSRTIRHSVLQGEFEVSRDPDLVLTTILGSCIACCLFDPVAKVGGMNHFLLAAPPNSMNGLGDDATRYGLYAMELLVNEMLKQGAVRATMRAHLYGGANLHSGMRAIGTENALFAEGFLKADGIALVRSDTGGAQARRLDLQPATGKVRCRSVQGALPASPAVRLPVATGEVELF